MTFAEDGSVSLLSIHQFCGWGLGRSAGPRQRRAAAQRPVRGPNAPRLPKLSVFGLGTGFDVYYHDAMAATLKALDEVSGDLSDGGRRFQRRLPTWSSTHRRRDT